MLEKLGRPSLMYVDLRPVNRPVVLITSHDVAEQVSRASANWPTSIPKSYPGQMVYLTGATSILVSHGDSWKQLRKRYSPAFAPQHLMTLLPAVLDKTMILVGHLERMAKTGEEFSLVTLGVNVAFDIIGAVVMDVDLEAQTEHPSKQGQLVQQYTALFNTYLNDKIDLPWWLIPSTELKRSRLCKSVDGLLKDIIRRKHQEHLSTSEDARRARSILSLSFQDVDELTPELIDETCDQIKTFLLAGHDTTGVTLSWVFYWLSRTPRALAAVRRELDDLLGSATDPASVRGRLSLPDGPELVQRMRYTSAVIKEALRLNPPAATARHTPPGTGFTVRTAEGQEHCLDGMIIYPCQRIIQRDPAVYGDTADTFVPERWLSEEGGSDTTEIPPGAFRAFERGPRNCIGQDFAMIELRAIVATLARHFDFAKVGLGEPALDEKGELIVGAHGILEAKSHLYIVSIDSFLRPLMRNVSSFN